MSDIQIFSFEANSIRTIVDAHGEPWFVGKDVAQALCYADTTNAIKQHCKGVAKHHPLQTTGGMQEVRIINEPDMLRLIVNSKLPSAEKFERWVFEDVLPTIRKTGAYSVTQEEAIPQTYAQALLEAGRLALQVEQQEAALALAAPKVQFVDSYVQASTGSLGFRQVCKLLGVKEPAFREFLLGEKIMYRLGGVLTAHQNHIDAGRFEVKTGVADSEHAYSSTKFTPKGVEWVAGEWGKFQVRGVSPVLGGSRV